MNLAFQPIFQTAEQRHRSDAKQYARSNERFLKRARAAADRFLTPLPKRVHPRLQTNQMSQQTAKDKRANWDKHVLRSHKHFQTHRENADSDERLREGFVFRR